MKMFIFFVGVVLLLTISCSKDNSKGKVETTLNQLELTLKPGDTSSVEIKTKDSTFLRDYSWSYRNSATISIEEEADGVVRFVGQKEGRAVLYVNYPSVGRIDSCVVIVGKPNLVRVLAIGNSFSEDALEGPLADIFKANNRQVVIGNMVIGGASFNVHLENSLRDAKAYSYRKINIEGERSTYEKVSLAEAIADESWDFISFQQVSQDGGNLSTFTTNLPMLYAYVNGLNKYPNTRYILHQTWAYAPYSSHSGFSYYDRDQIKMYNAICETYRSAAKFVPIRRVIASGTAIQNARQTELGDDLTRDGFHLSYDVGRLIVAFAWYEGLTRVNALNNPFKSASLSETTTEIAKRAAHRATQKPFEVSPM